MTTLNDLHRTVLTTLAGKRLGQPVFVRYLWQSQDPANALFRMVSIASTIREWLGQPLARIYATGSVESGQITLTLEFREGATALISWSQGLPRGGGVDFMVLGNRGALYHDAGSAALWDEAAAPPAGPVDAQIQKAIERALRSGRPEAFP